MWWLSACVHVAPASAAERLDDFVVRFERVAKHHRRLGPHPLTPDDEREVALHVEAIGRSDLRFVALSARGDDDTCDALLSFTPSSEPCAEVDGVSNGAYGICVGSVIVEPVSANSCWADHFEPLLDALQRSGTVHWVGEFFAARFGSPRIE